jgi:predicted ferric reductase
MGAYHGVLLFNGEPLTSPLGLLMLALAIIGSGCAIYSVIGRVGHTRKALATVASMAPQSNGVVDLSLQLQGAWPGHRAGQFALVTLDSREGPHPFTITSAWQSKKTLRFAIKPLGDFTGRIAISVKTGDKVWVEGPYGGFDFGSVQGPQLWVAGGIGLTPFLARLEALVVQGGARAPIVLFYSVRNEVEAVFPKELPDLCRRAGVELLMRIENRDGRLQSSDIGLRLSPQTSVWFCGPAAWGVSLRKTLIQQFGLTAKLFHQEHFQFR